MGMLGANKIYFHLIINNISDNKYHFIDSSIELFKRDGVYNRCFWLFNRNFPILICISI